MTPDFSFEKELWVKGDKYVVGLDEVGRGAFAGPVVVGAVVFPRNSSFTGKAGQAPLIIHNSIKIDDSKKLTARQRERADVWIRENALAVSVSGVSAKKIDRVGISRATHSGFRRVVKGIGERLHGPVHFILIDGFYIPYFRAKQLAIIDGDAKSFTIAAASIVAKVYRDKLMISLSKKYKYKKYQWGQNKGYGTKPHQEAIKKYGLTGYHRKSFLKTFLAQE